MSSQDTWIEGDDETAEVASARYERRDQLGRGSMGVVDAVYDSRLQRVVARKTLHKPEQARGFTREARIAARLEHPGIVPIYEADDGPDGPWYSMRRIDGRSLQEALGDCAGLDDRLRLLPAFLRLCEAMAYAHGQGVVHRDLKPSNVMLGDFGEVVVVDFGLAVVTEEARAGRIAGTPAYMSPEAANGETPSAPMDVWSLGAVLYQLLGGRPPYSGPAKGVIEAVRAGPPPRVATLEPEAPPELVAIVDKAMSRALETRYASASELRADVEAFTTGRLVSAHEYTPAELLRRFVQQYGGYLTLGAIALLLVSATVGVAYWRTSIDRDRAVRAEAERTRQLALALEARARSLGGDPNAVTIAEEALALDATLPWARGVLSEFASSAQATRVLQVPETGCRWGRALTDHLALLCDDEMLLVHPESGAILDREEWGRTTNAVGPDWVASLATQSSLRAIFAVDDQWSLIRLDNPQAKSIRRAVSSFVTVDDEGQPLHGRDDGDVVVLSGREGGVLRETHRTPALPTSFALRAGDGMQFLYHHEGAQLCDSMIRECKPFVFPGVVQHALWSADSQRLLVIATTGEAYVYDRENTRLALLDRTRAGGLQDVARVGKSLVATLDVTGRVEIFDLSGSLVGQLDGSALQARSLATTGSQLWLVGSNGVEAWEVSSPEIPATVRFSNGIGALISAPGGTYASFDRTVVRLDGQGFEPVFRAASFVKDLTWNDAGLVVASTNTGIHQIDGSGSVEVRSSMGSRRIGQTRGHLVWTANDHHLYVDGERTERSHGDMQVRGGRVIFERGNGVVSVRDIRTGTVVWELDANSEVWALALSEDGATAAFALEDHRVRQVDLATGEVTLLPGTHRSFIAVLRFSPSGRWLASGSWDGTSRLWEDGTLVAALEAHSGRVTTVAFASDDLLYTGSWDQTLRRWDLTAWE